MLIRKLINSQIWLSRKFDQLLPKELNVDGNFDFLHHKLPPLLQHGQVILDVGGGKNPYIGIHKKNEIDATLIGLDIDQHELEQAPAGTYDEIICADITQCTEIEHRIDLAICQSVFEHVDDVDAAIRNISLMLNPKSGKIVFFVPCKYAPFAMLNRFLPEGVKKNLLYFVFPQTERDQGFKAYYDKCTPREIRDIAERNSMTILDEQVYHMSGYFTFFFPLHLAWRAWMLIYFVFHRRYPVETFYMALQRSEQS